MKSDAVLSNFEPRPTREESFRFLPRSKRINPITPATWETSFTEALPLLRAMLRRYLRNEADLLEAMQQTALQATACRYQFRAEANLSTWLVSIAVNEARQILRKQNRRRDTVPLDLLDQELQDRRTTSPEEIARQAERQDWLRQAVGKLPPRYQTVVRLCELEERSIEQTAQLLQMTTSAVKSRRFRARLLLAKRLLQQHGSVSASL